MIFVWAWFHAHCREKKMKERYFEVVWRISVFITLLILSFDTIHKSTEIWIYQPFVWTYLVGTTHWNETWSWTKLKQTCHLGYNRTLLWTKWLHKFTTGYIFTCLRICNLCHRNICTFLLSILRSFQYLNEKEKEVPKAVTRRWWQWTGKCCFEFFCVLLIILFSCKIVMKRKYRLCKHCYSN